MSQWGEPCSAPPTAAAAAAAANGVARVDDYLFTRVRHHAPPCYGFKCSAKPPCCCAKQFQSPVRRRRSIIRHVHLFKLVTLRGYKCIIQPLHIVCQRLLLARRSVTNSAAVGRFYTGLARMCRHESLSASSILSRCTFVKGLFSAQRGFIRFIL